MMAASSKKRSAAAASSEDSSSDDEVLKRCQEAVWEAKVKEDVDSHAKQSKRVVVADHDHDGNELQVTKGFQTHVAKKLGNFLDSCISELQTTSRVESKKCDDDEGFRLFSTSVPGQEVEEAPVPMRRRRAPSSSDSDDEMEKRLKEAAVSIRDLLPSPVPRSTPTPPETLVSEKAKKKKKKAVEENDNSAAAKKKKRGQEKSDHVNSAGRAQMSESHGENSGSDQDQLKVKRKKKKKREKNTEEESLD